MKADKNVFAVKCGVEKTPVDTGRKDCAAVKTRLKQV